jgi:hypothetical protein
MTTSMAYAMVTELTIALVEMDKKGKMGKNGTMAIKNSTPRGRYDPPWQSRGWLQFGEVFLVGTKHDTKAGKSRQPRWTMEDILQVRDLVVRKAVSRGRGGAGRPLATGHRRSA